MRERLAKRCMPVAMLAGVFTLAGCATSPTGRAQLQLFPESQMAAMGATAFEDIKTETPVSRDPRVRGYVQCVARAITDQVGGSWEVTVFQSDQKNAFALPGGHIGVYTGLLAVTENQHQLATVVAHEVAHVLARHGNARVSANYATAAGLQLVQALAGAPTRQKQQLMGLLGLGAQVGVLLPYGRAQESEADVIGLELMARAGFDPRESVGLWQNMGRAGGGRQPPEFLSTHPSHGSRIRELEARMREAMQIYRQAQAQDRRPACGG